MLNPILISTLFLSSGSADFACLSRGFNLLAIIWYYPCLSVCICGQLLRLKRLLAKINLEHTIFQTTLSQGLVP